MKITRIDRPAGLIYVECELVALDQMHRALARLTTSDYSAEEMRGIIGQLVEGPLLQNATALSEEEPASAVPENSGGVEEGQALRHLIGRAWEVSTALEGHGIEPELRKRLDEALEAMQAQRGQDADSQLRADLNEAISVIERCAANGTQVSPSVAYGLRDAFSSLTQPHLSDEDRGRVLRIADRIDQTIEEADWPEMAEDIGVENLSDAAFLRKLASQPKGAQNV